MGDLLLDLTKPKKLAHAASHQNFYVKQKRLEDEESMIAK